METPPRDTIYDPYQPWPRQLLGQTPDPRTRQWASMPPRGQSGMPPEAPPWRNPPAAPRRAPQPSPANRMPKAQALAVAHALKRGAAVLSVASFGVLVALAAHHTVGVTARQGTTATSNSQSSGISASSAQSSSDGGSFFNSSSGGGYGFGSQSSGQSPASSTAVS